MENGKMESWKAMAELFLRKDIKAFIKDIDDNYYFCDILFVGEDQIRFQCFNPPSRVGEKISLYWLMVKSFEEFKEGGK